MLKHEHNHASGAFGRLIPCADSLGIAASVLCMIHCISVPILLMLAPALVSQVLHDDRTHYVLAFFVTSFCLLAIVPGYFKHSRKPILLMMSLGLGLVLYATFSCTAHQGLEVPLITAGNLLVVTAHWRNRRLLDACAH